MEKENGILMYKHFGIPPGTRVSNITTDVKEMWFTIVKWIKVIHNPVHRRVFLSAMFELSGFKPGVNFVLRWEDLQMVKPRKSEQ
jgi:hypothetical protein